MLAALHSRYSIKLHTEIMPIVGVSSELSERNIPLPEMSFYFCKDLHNLIFFRGDISNEHSLVVEAEVHWEIF